MSDSQDTLAKIREKFTNTTKTFGKLMKLQRMVRRYPEAAMDTASKGIKRVEVTLEDKLKSLTKISEADAHVLPSDERTKLVIQEVVRGKRFDPPSIILKAIHSHPTKSYARGFVVATKGEKPGKDDKENTFFMQGFNESEGNFGDLNQKAVKVLKNSGDDPSEVMGAVMTVAGASQLAALGATHVLTEKGTDPALAKKVYKEFPKSLRKKVKRVPVPMAIQSFFDPKTNTVASNKSPEILGHEMGHARNAQVVGKLGKIPKAIHQISYSDLSMLAGRVGGPFAQIFVKQLPAIGSIPVPALAALPLISKSVLKPLKGEDKDSKRYKAVDFIEKHPEAIIAPTFAPKLLEEGVASGRAIASIARAAGWKQALARSPALAAALTTYIADASIPVLLSYMVGKGRRRSAESEGKEKTLGGAPSELSAAEMGKFIKDRQKEIAAGLITMKDDTVNPVASVLSGNEESWRTLRQSDPSGKLWAKHVPPAFWPEDIVKKLPQFKYKGMAKAIKTEKEKVLEKSNG